MFWCKISSNRNYFTVKKQISKGENEAEANQCHTMDSVPIRSAAGFSPFPVVRVTVRVWAGFLCPYSFTMVPESFQSFRISPFFQFFEKFPLLKDKVGISSERMLPWVPKIPKLTGNHLNLERKSKMKHTRIYTIILSTLNPCLSLVVEFDIFVSNIVRQKIIPSASGVILLWAPSLSAGNKAVVTNPSPQENKYSSSRHFLLGSFPYFPDLSGIFPNVLWINILILNLSQISMCCPCLFLSTYFF